MGIIGAAHCGKGDFLLGGYDQTVENNNCLQNDLVSIYLHKRHLHNHLNVVAFSKTINAAYDNEVLQFNLLCTFCDSHTHHHTSCL